MEIFHEFFFGVYPFVLAWEWFTGTDRSDTEKLVGRGIEMISPATLGYKNSKGEEDDQAASKETQKINSCLLTSVCQLKCHLILRPRLLVDPEIPFHGMSLLDRICHLLEMIQYLEFLVRYFLQ